MSKTILKSIISLIIATIVFVTNDLLQLISWTMVLAVLGYYFVSPFIMSDEK